MKLLITGATVVTMNARRDIFRDGQVLIDDDTIVYAGPRAPRPKGLYEVLDARGHAVLPGLIHGHVHACQTLCRNHADGLELLDWLRERIWPFEAAHSEASLRASADLTFLELIRSGATAALDMGTVRHYDAVFSSARDCGFRLTGGKAMMDAGQGVPSALRETAEASLAECRRLIDAWHGSSAGRLNYALAPRFVLSCTEALLRGVVALAKEKGVRIHTHASENATECDVVREKTGMDNVAYFHSLGLLGPHTTLAHCVWLSAQEQKLVKETGTVVCHCPSANLKLASGFANIPQLLDAGIPCALGADGAPCNNNLDMFVEMRLASLIHKPKAGPTGMSAQSVLEMATLHGARALGLEKEIGSLEPGKKADLITVHLGGPHVTPAPPDVVSQLVYACQSRDVRDVLIAGKWVLKNRQLLTFNEARVVATAQRQAAKLLAQLG